MILSGLARDQAGAKRRGGAPKARRVGGFLARMPRAKELSTGGGAKLLVKHLYTYLKPYLLKTGAPGKPIRTRFSTVCTCQFFYRLHVYLSTVRTWIIYRLHVTGCCESLSSPGVATAHACSTVCTWITFVVHRAFRERASGGGVCFRRPASSSSAPSIVLATNDTLNEAATAGQHDAGV